MRQTFALSLLVFVSCEYKIHAVSNCIFVEEADVREMMEIGRGKDCANLKPSVG